MDLAPASGAQLLPPFLVVSGAGDQPPVFTGFSVPGGVRQGNPIERIFYHLQDEKLKTNVGFWEAEPGVIRFDGFPWNEFCVVLDGHLEVKPDGIAPISLRSGQAFFIRKTFHGEWVLHSRVRKYFVECLLD